MFHFAYQQLKVYFHKFATLRNDINMLKCLLHELNWLTNNDRHIGPKLINQMSALSFDACCLQKLRTDLQIVSSGRWFQIFCSVVSGLLRSVVAVSAHRISQTWLPTHGSRESSGLGCSVVRSSLSMNSEQCLPSHSFCAFTKFALKTCVSVNLAYIK